MTHSGGGEQQVIMIMIVLPGCLPAMVLLW
jgi:hypothetical protein